MRGVVAVSYGLMAYAFFWLAAIYTIGFVGNLFVPNSIDGAPGPASVKALLIDCGLLAFFACQHSLMARKGFKSWWTRIIPQPIERSTYVLVSSLFLLVLFWQWRPITVVVWQVRHPGAQTVLEALFWLGWVIALHASFLIDHADFLGLRQVCLYVRGEPCEPVVFKMPDLYGYVRHPLMMGLLLAFWATPVMTLGHLVFSTSMTAYILVGIRLEEGDLMELYGEAYREYLRRVSMLIPLPRRK